MTLPAVRGHEEVRARLARAATAGTLPQSILLHGPEGIGKERVGLWVAQLVVCQSPSLEGPCGACQPCRLVLRLEHPDVHWFFPLPRPESAADRLREKLEEARAAELALRRRKADHVPAYEKAPAHFLAAVQTIQQLASVRPAIGRRKVFVVGDAELMVPQEASQEAANAFLKLLEEPPADTTLVVTTAHPGALLPTIRSRVLPVRMTPLPEAEVLGYLSQELGVDAGQAERVARAARGAIGRALRLLPGGEKGGEAQRFRDRAKERLLAALSASAIPRFVAANGQAPAGGRGDFTGELQALAEWLRDLLAVTSGAGERVLDPDALALLERAVAQYGLEPLAVGRALDRVSAALHLASGNVNPQLILADLLAGMNRDLRGGELPDRPAHSPRPSPASRAG